FFFFCKDCIFGISSIFSSELFLLSKSKTILVCLIKKVFPLPQFPLIATEKGAFILHKRLTNIAISLFLPIASTFKVFSKLSFVGCKSNDCIELIILLQVFEHMFLYNQNYIFFYIF